MSAPDLMEPVIGYREWNAMPDGRLEPMVVGNTWLPGVNTAKCFLGDKHPAPCGECYCGLHATIGERAAFLIDDGYNSLGQHAIGAVIGWGELEVHFDGWRAQYARVVALLQPRRHPYLERGRPDPSLALHSARYHAPVCSDATTLRRVAAEHGRDLPASLVPPVPVGAARVPRITAIGSGGSFTFTISPPTLYSTNGAILPPSQRRAA